MRIVGSQSARLHTCWKNVDQETAGHDGILDNLMGFAGEFYILFSIHEGQQTTEKLRSESETCLGIGRSDPDAIRILDDVLAKRTVKKSTWSERVVPFRRLERKRKTRHALSNCTNVIVGMGEKLLEEQTRVR